MSEHSLLSASAANRWLTCPISVTGKSDDSSSEVAAEGTALHEVCENVLRGKDYPPIGTTLESSGFKFFYTQDRHDDCAVYVDYIRSLSWDGGYQVEAKVNYGIYLNVANAYAFGTADCYGFVGGLSGRVLHIVDLKMGRKPVNPVKNPQAALYGAGVLQSLLPLMLPREFPVKISIVQPRLSRKPFTWETTVGWIEDTAMAARGPAAAAVAYATDRATKETFTAYPEVAGSHCQYCRRKSQCVVFKSHVAKASQPLTSQWDPAVFSMRSTIKGYLEELEQFALDQALVGNVLEGTKLVRGRNGNAQLQIPQEEIRELAKGLNIESAIVEMKEVWVTPAKIRDAFKKTGMADVALKAIVKSPEGSLQIADAADPRPVAALSTEGNASAFEGVAKAPIL